MTTTPETYWQHVGAALGRLAAAHKIVFYESWCGDGWVCTVAPRDEARRARPFYAPTAMAAVAKAEAFAALQARLRAERAAGAL